ncbi:MAG TPA: hypothetical protein VK925_07815 [Jiangellaceae bacterium]|nr:hypothetical protein [Jiangellaceae bacterium]
MAWTWRFLDRDGDPVEPSEVGRFSTQADAETWLGQTWQDLVADGVAAVTLYDDGREVYGPMSLDPDG